MTKWHSMIERLAFVKGLILNSVDKYMIGFFIFHTCMKNKGVTINARKPYLAVCEQNEWGDPDG
ncbi:hypothetical protein [Bacillus stratosphericus]|uniref:hypothetical protein n=1 Tax=Bacillus stratosphericus TaxID=293386 RepID=UPI001CFB5986|nr:hypothetical protein [Bacillus stratosphericus]